VIALSIRVWPKFTLDGLFSTRLVQISFSTLPVHLHACQGVPPPPTLSSHLPRRAVGPKRSRISYAVLPKAPYAALFTGTACSAVSYPPKSQEDACAIERHFPSGT
jgi:hypothetical protein